MGPPGKAMGENGVGMFRGAAGHTAEPKGYGEHTFDANGHGLNGVAYCN